MKTFKLIIFSTLFFALSQNLTAQNTNDKFKVAGECGMCKKKIETAAKSAGATYAAWNADTKELEVKYNSSSSNAAKIQKSIAAVGYDTPKYRATDEAYENLHECCKYDRTAATENCCADGKCTKCDSCKDGKCEKQGDCCKDGNCTKGDCCKKGSTEMISESAGKAKTVNACCSKH
jgi:hypothetical protein